MILVGLSTGFQLWLINDDNSNGQIDSSQSASKSPSFRLTEFLSLRPKTYKNFFQLGFLTGDLLAVRCENVQENQSCLLFYSLQNNTFIDEFGKYSSRKSAHILHFSASSLQLVVSLFDTVSFKYYIEVYSIISATNNANIRLELVCSVDDCLPSPKSLAPVFALHSSHLLAYSTCSSVGDDLDLSQKLNQKENSIATQFKDGIHELKRYLISLSTGDQPNPENNPLMGYFVKFHSNLISNGSTVTIGNVKVLLLKNDHNNNGGKELCSFHAHSHHIHLLQFDSSGLCLASCSVEGSTLLLTRLFPPSYPLFSKLDSGAVSVSDCLEPKLWHKMARLHRGYTPADIDSICFSPDSSLLAVCSRNGSSIHLWDLSCLSRHQNSHRDNSILPIEGDDYLRMGVEDLSGSDLRLKTSTIEPPTLSYWYAVSIESGSYKWLPYCHASVKLVPIPKSGNNHSNQVDQFKVCILNPRSSRLDKISSDKDATTATFTEYIASLSNIGKAQLSHDERICNWLDHVVTEYSERIVERRKLQSSLNVKSDESASSSFVDRLRTISASILPSLTQLGHSRFQSSSSTASSEHSADPSNTHTALQEQQQLNSTNEKQIEIVEIGGGQSCIVNKNNNEWSEFRPTPSQLAKLTGQSSSTSTRPPISPSPLFDMHNNSSTESTSNSNEKFNAEQEQQRWRGECEYRTNTGTELSDLLYNLIAANHSSQSQTPIPTQIMVQSRRFLFEERQFQIVRSVGEPVSVWTEYQSSTDYHSSTSPLTDHIASQLTQALLE